MEAAPDGDKPEQCGRFSVNTRFDLKYTLNPDLRLAFNFTWCRFLELSGNFDDLKNNPTICINFLLENSFSMKH